MLLDDRMSAEIGIIGADFPIPAFGSLWVVAADRPKPAVTRVDPDTNEILAEILVPGRLCNGLAAGFGSIWACAGDGIARIDPATNRVTAVIDVPAIGQTRLAVAGGSVWAFTSQAGVEPANSLLRINPRTGRAVTIALGHVAGTMTAAYGYLWITSVDDGLLLRVDPTTGTVETVMDGLPQPFFVSAGLASLWISLHANEEGGGARGQTTVIRVDPRTFDVQAEVPAGPIGTTGEVVAGETGIWVRSASTFLTRFDARSYEPLEVINATKGGGSVVLAFDTVWVTSYDFGHLWRIDP